MLVGWWNVGIMWTATEFNVVEYDRKVFKSMVSKNKLLEKKLILITITTSAFKFSTVKRIHSKDQCHVIKFWFSAQDIPDFNAVNGGGGGINDYLIIVLIIHLMDLLYRKLSNEFLIFLLSFVISHQLSVWLTL